MFAAAQIYNMLMDYKGNVTVRIDGIAASAASMIAMAGEPVEMSPVGMFMIHNPATVAIGDKKEMQAAIEMLGEVKEGIINAYELKTGLSHDVLSDYMDAETWFNAKKALELGFVDKILFANDEKERAVLTLLFTDWRNLFMATIMDLREKRAKLWEGAKAFLDSHRDKEGKLSAEDAAAYDKMEADVVALGKDIERMERQAAIDAELAKPTAQPIVNTPQATVPEKKGRASDEYRKAMLSAIRSNFRNVYAVHTSAFCPEMPTAQPTKAQGDKGFIAFGDYSYYNIGDRGIRSIQELRELFAGNGMIAYVMKERVDGKLVLPEAVQILYAKAATA